MLQLTLASAHVVGGGAPFALQTPRGRDIALQPVDTTAGAESGGTVTQSYRVPEFETWRAMQVAWGEGNGLLLVRDLTPGAGTSGILVRPGTLSPMLSASGGRILPNSVALLSQVPAGFDLLLPQAPAVVLFLLAIGLLSFSSKPLLTQVLLYAAGSGLGLWLSPLVAPELPMPGMAAQIVIAATTLLAVLGNIAWPVLGVPRKVLVALCGALHGALLGERLLAGPLPLHNTVPALLGASIGLWLAIATIFLLLHILLANWVEKGPVLAPRLRLSGSALIGLAALILLLFRIAA